MCVVGGWGDSRGSPVQACHQQGLHPGLGHPAASAELKELELAEKQRHSQCLEHIQQHITNSQAMSHNTTIIT